MSINITPNILIVDDEDASGNALLSQIGSHAKVVVRHPDSVTEAELKSADLVLVDFGIENWPSRERSNEIALQPVDGLALISILQRRIFNSTSTKMPEQHATAFAIYTARIQELANPLPADSREHILSRLNNVEWIFKKTDSDIHQRTVQLAKAVKALPKNWPLNDAASVLDLLTELLAVPAKDWKQPAIDSITACLPPIHELSDASHGLAILRWLLQRVTPYPCFLWSDTFLATRLRLSPEEFRANLKESEPFRAALSPYLYNGILSGFAGQLWWRVGIERFLWDSTNGQSSNPHAVRAFLESLTKTTTKSAIISYPVVCVDKNFRPSDKIIGIRDAVRIQPDDWPSFADPAWAPIDEVKNDSKMRSMIMRDDIEKLG